MGDEQVFTVTGSVAEPATPVSLSEVGLTERAHLQEWVLAHPSILGPGIMIVTFEFDRWWSSGGNPLDRLDVLGLDRSGQLVVAELKRGAAPDTVEMQAVKYAAMASRFTAESLASQHARFLASRGPAVTDDEALNALEEHTEAKSLTVETLRQPRIVLLAASFPPVVTATAVWLREMGPTSPSSDSKRTGPLQRRSSLSASSSRCRQSRTSLSSPAPALLLPPPSATRPWNGPAATTRS